MDTIFVKGLEISACHGVNDSEKIRPQPFVFDIELGFDLYKAGRTDDLGDTVNYSAVCKTVTEVVCANSFNLIEKLAAECAFAILDKFPVSRVSLTLNKPDAPMNRKFESVGVRVEYERETVYLSLGSSLGDRKGHIDGAIAKLAATRGIEVKKRSAYIETPPYGGVAVNKFLNCAAEIITYLPPHALLSEIHRIEDECGRVRGRRWDDRTLDIDIIFYGGRVIRTPDLTVPHPEYYKRDFVLSPLKAVAGEFVCPIFHKKIKDI